MTRIEIKQCNEEIARMLGYKSGTNSYRTWWFHKNRSFKRLTFHTDWNQLMFAVDCIESINISILSDTFSINEYYIVTINGKICNIKSTLIYEDNNSKNKYAYYDTIKGTSKKESVFMAVFNFAKFYNNTIKNV